MLEARGCRLAQGFLFDRPMTADAFRDRLDTVEGRVDDPADHRAR